MQILRRLITACALLAPALAAAHGDYVVGYVNVTPNGDGLYGTFNVRFNTNPTSYPAYIGAGGYANGLLYFYGQDGNGRQFYCYVPPASAIYSAAVDIKNTLGGGSFLAVQRVPPSSECSSVYSGKASHYLY